MPIGQSQIQLTDEQLGNYDQNTGLGKIGNFIFGSNQQIGNDITHLNGGLQTMAPVGIAGLQAYTGLQQLGNADRQIDLGYDQLNFQKDAFNQSNQQKTDIWNMNQKVHNARAAGLDGGGQSQVDRLNRENKIDYKKLG